MTQSSNEEHPMIPRTILFAAAAVIAALAMQSSAHALTMTECSAKYKDAKAAGTLNGASWNDFRKSQCDAGTGSGTAKTSAAPARTIVVAANAVFPSAVDAKYSSEKPGRARRKTWKWLQKGRRLLQPVRQEAQRRGVNRHCEER
jgi:hypothetical protein